jgi:multidrug resistance efflux pump
LVFIRIFPLYFLVIFVGTLLSGYITLFNIILPAIFIVKFYQTLLGYLFLPIHLIYTLVKTTFSPLTPHNIRWRAATLTTVLAAGALFITLYHLPERVRTNCQITLLPQMVVPVRSAKEGIVREILVKDQELVRAGQVLARLADPDLETERTQLELALANLQRQHAGFAPQLALQQSLIASASVQQQSDQANVTDALATPQSTIKELQLELAKVVRLQQECRDLKARYENLAAEKVAPLSQVERLELRCAGLDYRYEQLQHQLARAQLLAQREVGAQITTSVMAESQLVAAKKRLQELQAAQTVVDQQIAALRTDLAMVDTTSRQLTIVAPRDGVVMGQSLPQLLGRRLGPGGKICEIGDLQQMRIEVELPEWQRQRLQPGQPLRVIMHSQAEIIIDGWLDNIKNEPFLKPSGERIFLAYFNLPQPLANLHAGQSGEAFVTIAQRTLWQRMHSRGQRFLFDLGIMTN